MDKNTLYKITVQSKDIGLRLDKFLSQMPEIVSRSQAEKIISDHKVSCGGQILKASYKVQEGDLLEVVIPPVEKQDLSAYKIDVDIIYEDSDLLVVNKPAGLVVHPAPGHLKDTLVNALFFRKKLSKGSHELRPGIVHRLDKQTSGLLILAKTDDAEKNLIEQFKAKTIQRLYWAVVLQPPRPLESRIESYLSRHPIMRQKFISTGQEKSGSKQAITHYKTLKEHESGCSLLECQLETGRTHQIRVHLNSIDCPVLGDRLYSKRQPKNKEIQKMLADSGRIMLHAYQLSFLHPTSKKTMKFQVDWPEDLKDILKILKFIN